MSILILRIFPFTCLPSLFVLSDVIVEVIVGLCTCTCTYKKVMVYYSIGFVVVHGRTPKLAGYWLVA